ncbi:MAG: nucleotidyltransferase domain-containing protein [Oscillospiraceae bacterium]|nr:nucleotidyltransferase domain-containing protein [Oscillospiraceae bacterium]
MNEEILKIRDKIVNTVPVEKLYLFGSYANGTQHEQSDYDFYMVVPNDGIRPIDAIGDAHLAMRGMKVKPVDILAGTVEIFNRRSRQLTIERKIANEGVVLYERGR